MTAYTDAHAFNVREEQLVLKYRAIIQEIGEMVPEFLPHGILIFFGEQAPAELREVSLVHNGNQLISPIVAGDVLRFTPPSHESADLSWYRFTAVGDMANSNLAELGHLVVHFDAATEATLPGAASAEPSLTALPSVGTIVELFGLENN